MCRSGFKHSLLLSAAVHLEYEHQPKNILLTSIFKRKKSEVYKALSFLVCLLYFAAAKLGPCVKIYLSAFEVSITDVLVACTV